MTPAAAEAARHQRTLRLPAVRHRRDPYQSPQGAGIAGFVRGLSVRDVEAALTEALGESATVSKSTVSRACEQIKGEFQAWSRRRLDDVRLDYLFLDGSHFTYHANAGAEPVLAASGIDTDGKPVFIGLDAAGSESGGRLGWLPHRPR